MIKSWLYACRSALHLAARAGALDVLEVLLEDLEKPDRLEYVNAADKSGITPVFLAKQRGEQIRMLTLEAPSVLLAAVA